MFSVSKSDVSQLHLRNCLAETLSLCRTSLVALLSSFSFEITETVWRRHSCRSSRLFSWRISLNYRTHNILKKNTVFGVGVAVGVSACLPFLSYSRLDASINILKKEKKKKLGQEQRFIPNRYMVDCASVRFKWIVDKMPVSNSG